MDDFVKYLKYLAGSPFNVLNCDENWNFNNMQKD